MKKGKHGGEGDSRMERTTEEEEEESGWMEGAGVRRRGGSSGREEHSLLTQLESCELLVNGVLIQRR